MFQLSSSLQYLHVVCDQIEPFQIPHYVNPKTSSSSAGPLIQSPHGVKKKKKKKKSDRNTHTQNKKLIKSHLNLFHKEGNSFVENIYKWLETKIY